MCKKTFVLITLLLVLGLMTVTSAAAVSLPGRVEAEDYNTGGEGVGYHDTTSGNSGTEYRSDDVDIETTEDVGGGYNVGWIAGTEWLAFDVNINSAGTYDITARVASAHTTDKTLHITIDGNNVTGPMTFNTGGAGWQVWLDKTFEDINLPAGSHELRICMDNTGFDLNYVDITASAPDTNAPSPDPMTWATEPSATGTTSISMTATTATDTSGVEYYFDCTAGGGNDSSWQDSTTYEDTGLDPNTQYTYKIKARDKSSNQNETGYSTTKSATTQSAGATYIDATFDSDADGFTYADITNGSYVDGTWNGSYGYSGGGIRVRTGPGPTGGATDGQYSDGFNLSSAGWVTITLRYRLEMGEGFESNEYGEAYLMIDSTRYGDGTGDSLVRIVGDGNGGGTDDSGWLSGEFNANLSSGSHTIKVGAYNNASTASDEWVNAYFDNVKVEDSNAPNPDPMTWATDPYATGITSFSMTATPATDASSVEYYFDCTAGGGNDSGWQDSVTYEDTGLSASTQYTYKVKARDKSSNQNETGYSTAKSATTDAEADTTAPSPDPMTWATQPYATGTSSVSMTATTATDTSGVEYYFDCTAGAGGSDSGWQDSATYEDTGLDDLTQYTYRVKARDKSSNQNETAYSTTKSATTQDGTAPSPDPMTWSTDPYATSSTSISMTATTATDPCGVEYYFDCTAGGGNDSGWQDSATYEDTGLSELTQYTYRVKARDKSSNQNETAYSTTKSATTQDGTVPTPNPMTWSTEPYATGASSISMTATTATDASGVEYYFDCTAGGGNDSGWQDSATYTDTGLAELTQYTYRVKARDKSSNQNETGYSTTKSATTQDGTAPSPDPMTWATDYATGATSISMTATTATDASGVEYYFECTAGGGHDSGWQDSATYTDTGLIEQRQYSYRVKARDKSSNQNETAYSTTKSATTSADTTAPSPDPMQWATGPYAVGATSISMTAVTATDPCGVEYYFECTGGAGGSDSGWQDGTTYTDTGLIADTQYTYKVQARDKSGNQNATAWSNPLSATTEAVSALPDPVGWWKLDETSGTVAYDSAGNNDGNVVEAVWVDGHSGKALSFDEIDDYVKIPDFDYTSEANEFSVCFWFKIDDVAGNLYQYMFSHNKYNANNSINVYFRESSEQVPERVRTVVRLNDRTTWAYDTPSTLADGQWHMYTITASSTDGATIYIDANSVGVNPNLKGSSLNPDTDIYLGARCDLNPNRFYGNPSTDDGLLDDVRIYSQALTEEEVGYIYTGAVTEATNPSPANEANDVSANAVLSWTPGEYAASHDVYLGTDFNSVANAEHESDEYMGNFDTNSYDPNGLEYSTTYYWAVDEVNDTSLWLGDVWSFTTAAVPDTNAPAPDPMTWATEPYAAGATSVSMTATTATDASGVEYYFECTAGGGNSSGWQDSVSYTDTGLAELTQYTYRVKARDKSSSQNETAYSTTKSATTQDSTAPSPDPMTWISEPNATGPNSISMTATTATDASGVEYYFDCTTPGGHDSGWQDGTAYEDTGLDPNTQYSYQVKARDKSSNQNETGWSTTKPATTQVAPDTSPPSPNPMTWSTEPYATGSTSISMTATTATDSSGVEYYFECTAGGGNSSSWQDSTTYEDTGLSEVTQYTYRVKARDKSSNQNETGYSTTKSATTQDGTAPSPDPMTWATEPNATGTTTISMTATTATDTSGVEYYFECTAGGGNSSSWQDSTTYEDTGLSPSTQYSYRVKARDKSASQNETGYSTVKSATTDSEGDTTAPGPDPMTWATEPYAAGPTSISMTATTATDASGVEYYFECTAGGGNDSGWQDSATYTDTGLSELTTYSYRVKARDKSTNQNETAYSAVKSAKTQDGTAPSPDPMTWATEPYGASISSISMTATTATDPCGVEYYFECTAGGGNDSGWQDSATYTDTGLSEATQYNYRVRARDKSSNQNQTGYSATKPATTQDGTAPSPDPMTWATDPYATGSTSISMTATTATDVSGVEYYFDETSGNPGGTDSGWQDNATYQDAGLSPSTQYTYQVKARDKSSNQNETGYSTSKSATTQEIPAEPNLVGWWKFDENSGTTAADGTGTNDGTVYGAVWVGGTRGNALSFDEVDDYVTIPDFDYTNASDEFSVCFWFKIDDVAGTLWQYMFSHNTYNVDNSLNVYFRESSEVENPEKVRTVVRLNDSTTWAYDTPASLADGQWHMYAITVSSTDGGKIYIDGSSVGSDPNLKGASFNPSTDIYIGARCDLNADRFYGNPSTDDGLLDDVRIYDEVLSADDIDGLYVGHFAEATGPNPTDGATDVSKDVVLSWQPGYYVADVDGHDVYLGTDYNSVADANQSSAEYKGNFDTNSYDPNGLSYSTTYYWAVDEINDTNIWPGDVWSFTTEAEPGMPEKATNPYPVHQDVGVSNDVDLSWTAGFDATSHDVYFGTSSPGTFQDNQTATTFDLGTLNNETTYYWRIDEKNIVGTTTGDVWSFTTGGNQPPVADAGPDQIVEDSDSNGTEVVSLDASASYDSDGTISSYVWREDTNQIAMGVSPNVSFSTGSHTVVLTVTDNDNATDTDTVVITVTSPGGGTTYYTDFDSGSDNNNGTSTSTPWKHCPCDDNATGTAAATTLQAGDTVIFKGGVHYFGEIKLDVSGSSGDPIVFDGDTAQTWGSGKAVINGSDPLTGWTPCESAADCGGAANWQNMYETTLPSGSDDVWVVNLFEGNTLLAVAQGPTPPDPFFYDNISAYNSVPQSDATTTSIKDSSFFTQSSSSAWDGAYVHVWVQGNQVYTVDVTSFNPSTDTIYFSTLSNPPYTRYAMANSVLVLDAAGEYVVNESSGEVYLWPHSGTSNITVSVRKNGFALNGKSYVTIQGFKIIKFSAGFNDWGNGSGINNAVSGSNYVTIRNNEVAYNRGMSKCAGMDIRYGASNSTIENNYIHENLRSRGLLVSGSNTTVANNLLQKNGGTGIYMGGASNMYIIGNTVLDHAGMHGNGMTAYQGCSNILYFGNTVRGGTNALTTQAANTITIAYNVLQTNISNVLCVADWTSEGQHSPNLHYYNNVMIHPGGNALYTGGTGLIVKNNIIDGWGDIGETGSYNIYTSLCWNQSEQYGWYPGTGEIIEQDKSKVFIDSANFDYHLKSNSPAVDAGTSLGYSEDIEGNAVPSGSAVDIGAYEYQQ